jgi:hypothetical protein
MMAWIVQSRLRTILAVLIFFSIFLLSTYLFFQKPTALIPKSAPEAATDVEPSFREDNKHKSEFRRHPSPIKTPDPGRSLPPVSTSLPSQGNYLSLLTAIVSMLGTLSTIYFAWLDHHTKQKGPTVKYDEYERNKLSPPGP